MRRLMLAAALMLGFAASTPAQKVYIDYDASYDPSHIKTFAWVESAETSLAQSNPLLHSRIVNGIEYYLTQDGTRELATDGNPDIYVTYHASSKEEVSFNTSSFGYGYPSSWAYGGPYGWGGPGYYGGVATSTTTVSTYVKGTLVVDVWDAATKKLVWRGTAANMTVSDSPGKMQKRLDKALYKMVKEWRSIRQKNLKAAAKEK